MAMVIERRTPAADAELRRETYLIREFSAIAGISVTAVRKGIRENDLPVAPIRIGGQWMFPRKPVDRMLGHEMT